MKYKPKKRPKANLPSATTLRLKDNHTWTAPEGHKIVVMDRGLVSFNIPESWVVTDMDPFTVRDAPVPDDKAGLQVTAFRLPPHVDMSGLPLGPMLLQATANPQTYQVLARSELIRAPRTDIELVWLEDRFLDPKEKREAYSRHAAGRGFNVQVLITFSYWAEDEAWCTPVWEEALRSLQLGRVIADPTRGVTLH
jgi:hypothetical protein